MYAVKVLESFKCLELDGEWPITAFFFMKWFIGMSGVGRERQSEGDHNSKNLYVCNSKTAKKNISGVEGSTL